LNESRIWLEIAKRSNMATLPKLQPVLTECDELCRIISSSIQIATARAPN
jgi:four helix bundle protein